MLQIFTHASLCSQIADEAEIRLTGSLEKLRTDYINYLNHFVPLAIETHLIKTGDAKVDVQRGKRLAMALRDMYGWMLDQDIYTLPMLSKMFAQTDEEQRNALALYPTPQDFMGLYRQQPSGKRYGMSNRDGSYEFKNLPRAFMQKMHYLDDLFKEAKDVRGGLDKIVEYVQRELEAATQQKALFKVEECDEIKWIVRATLNRVRYRNDDETMCTMKDFEGVDDDEMSFVPKFAYVDGQQRKWAMNTMHELLALKETHKGSPAHRLAVGHFYTYTHVLLRASLSDTINILKTQAQLSASYPVEPYGRIMRGQLRLQIDYMCITFDCIIQLAREMLADFLKGEKAIEDIMDHNMRDTRLLELLKERFDGEAEYNVEEAIDEVQQGIDEKHAEDRRRRLEWLRSRRDTLKEQEFRNQWIKDHPEFTEKFKELSSICMRLNRIAYTKVDLSEQEKKEMRNADKEKQNLMKPREEWVQQQMNEWKQLPQPTDEELLGEMKEVHPIVCPF